MTPEEIAHAQAMILFEKAYKQHMRGEIAEAVDLYQRSLEIQPTAEAFTFLGWAYSMVNRVDAAIEMCQNAIEVDPGFGNPYNDIGAYLIEKGDAEAAIPWLEQATIAPRYETPEFAYTNLGRAYQRLGRYRTALENFDQALEIDPLYMPAQWAKTALLGKMN